MARLVLWLAVGFSCVLGACVVAGLLCKAGEKLRALRRAGWACVIAAIIATIHGGTKNILARFSADDGITATSAEFTSATNDVESAYLAYSYVGGSEESPLWVRQSVSNEWDGITTQGWFPEERYSLNGTNYVLLVHPPVASNAMPFAMYWIGNNPPPVEIEESGGVEIVSFNMSAQGVAITYAVDGSVLHGKVGALAVGTSQGNGPLAVVHETNVAETVTNTFTQSGFFVDRLTRWRVRMEVEK